MTFLTTKANILSTEYALFYNGYIQLAPDGLTIENALKHSFEAFFNYFKLLDEKQALYSYAPGKWNLKEVLVHCIDTERIMSYRALRFARNDQTELPGFEQDYYVPQSNANSRNMNDLLDEYKALRQSTIHLFKSFNDDVLKRAGLASGNSMSVRALGFMISGHEIHHLNICKERYLLD
jgi:hypothetical protein